MEKFQAELDNDEVGTWYSMLFRGTKIWGRFNWYVIRIEFNVSMDDYKDTDILGRVPYNIKLEWVMHLVFAEVKQQRNENGNFTEKFVKIGHLQPMEGNEFSETLEEENWMGSTFRMEVDNQKYAIQIDVLSKWSHL